MTSSRKSAMESLDRIANNEKYHGKTRQIAGKIFEEMKSIKIDSKMIELKSLIEKILKENSSEKILIYTKHPSTVEYMIEELSEFGLKITSFKGGLTREEKAERINEFRKKSQVLICTDAGAEGLNLQFCRILINYDLPWNPMSVEQRIGRLDRIGQKRDMQIYSLAMKDTMEEYVVDLIINKMCCVGLVIGELPIILFNLGLDSESKYGRNKVEERLLFSFVNSKNNLDLFAKDVSEISKMIERGIEDHEGNKKSTTELLDKKELERGEKDGN